MIWVKILFVSLTKFQPKAFFNFNFNQIASRTPNSSLWLHAGYLHLTLPNLMTYVIMQKDCRMLAVFN